MKQSHHKIFGDPIQKSTQNENLVEQSNQQAELQDSLNQSVAQCQYKDIHNVLKDVSFKLQEKEKIREEYPWSEAHCKQNQLKHAIENHQNQVVGFMRQYIIPPKTLESDLNNLARFGYNLDKQSTSKGSSKADDVSWSAKTKVYKEQEPWKPCYMKEIPKQYARELPKEWSNWKRWITWKWKWALAATKAKELLNQVQGWEMLKAYLFREGKRSQVKNSKQRYGYGLPYYCQDTFQEQNIQQLIMSAWNVFIRKITSDSNNTYVARLAFDKLMASLPWWLRRIAERRKLERYFHLWRKVTLKSMKEKSKSVKKGLINAMRLEHVCDAKKDPYIPYYVKVGNAEALVALRHMRGPYQVLKVYQKEMPPNQLHLGKLPGMHVSPRLGKDARLLYGPTRSVRSDVISTHGICPTFTIRALRVLQVLFK